jgi:CIC family chloride channel protein
MIAVVVGNLVVSQIFKQRSIFHSQLYSKGLDLKINPLSQHLRRIGVAGLMDRKVIVQDNKMITLTKANQLLSNTPTWLLIRQKNERAFLMLATDLARYILEKRAQQQINELKDEGMIDLLAIPANRQNIASVYLQANLEEALDTMEREAVKVVYIFRTLSPTAHKIYGIVSKRSIESYYSYK